MRDRLLSEEAEAATLATMDQGKAQYSLDDRTAIEFGYGFLAGFENAKRLGVTTMETRMALRTKKA
jgi:hypothetical protein